MSTACQFSREDVGEGPRRDYLERLQVGMLVELIQNNEAHSLEEVVRLARGSLYRMIEDQFSQKRQKKKTQFLPKAARALKPSNTDASENYSASDDLEWALREEEKDREWADKMSRPVILHCVWAVKPETGMPVEIRPRRRGGPRRE